MTKFSKKLKKSCFWHILGLPNFWGKKYFPRKSHSVTHNFTWDSSTMRKFRKVNDTIPKKHPDRWKDGRTEGQMDGRMDGLYFIGPFQPPLWVQKKQGSNSPVSFELSGECFANKHKNFTVYFS